MAIVKAEELRAKTADELKTQLVGLKQEQFNLRFQTAGGQNENRHAMRSCVAKSPVSKRSLAKGQGADAAK